jgi:hypothetical protein
VPGANLRPVNTSQGKEYSTVTSGDGYYSFQLLPAGAYCRSIAKPGFNTLEPGSGYAARTSHRFRRPQSCHPYSEAWNFDLRQELPGRLKLDTAYVGNRGVHNYNDLALNQLPDADLALGNQLLTTVANPFYGQIASGTLSTPTVTLAQLLRPYPQYSGVTAQNSTWGASTYNALQVRLEKQITHGFTINAAYA